MTDLSIKFTINQLWISMIFTQNYVDDDCVKVY